MRERSLTSITLRKNKSSAGTIADNNNNKQPNTNIYSNDNVRMSLFHNNIKILLYTGRKL